MPEFRFEAKDEKGANVSGQLNAESEREAVRQLQSQGYFLRRLVKQKGPSVAAAVPSSAWRDVAAPVFIPVSSKAMSLFFSSFASMLAAGMSIHEATHHLAERAPGRILRRAAREMSEAALEGKRMTTVAIRHPAAFSPFVVAMLETGEASGMLERSMRQMAEYFQRAHALEMLFRLETFYVKILIICAILIPTLPLLVLSGFKAWLPVALTRTLPILMGLIAFWYGWRLLMRYKVMRQGVDRLKLSFPIIGSIVRRNAMAKWCRAMTMLFDAGVPLSVSLEAAGMASGNMALAASTSALAHRVSAGEPVSTVMAESGEFSDTAVDMMITGERSGDISGSLTKVAEYCESESETASKQSAVLLGVVAYLIVALIIGYMVFSFYSGYFGGIFELGEE
ncbi:MAG: hypothetical protein GTO55_00220, partial [Armatimonadetes bacterium]|nr:hypothetical protein [Armatimonadota bacterium]NIM22765.1 hypothetical protein [Armatimonadota bacterium]NIM66590.1 hypothetical protein [Armatimonadota bacterium]NIM75189.1 hypothetical protein [Armatimonadota bacterium]NIN04819.1 hypothetical protein [Armatimonadota bacterium]